MIGDSDPIDELRRNRSKSEDWCDWCSKEVRLYRKVRDKTFAACNEHLHLMPQTEEDQEPAP